MPVLPGHAAPRGASRGIGLLRRGTSSRSGSVPPAMTSFRPASARASRRNGSTTPSNLSTTRNPRVNRRLRGRRTVLTVRQATSTAITVILPAPVASLSARRSSPGFASSPASSRYWRKRRPDRPAWGATSASQMAVSTPRPGEEGADAGEAVVAPVLEQARGLRGHPPLPRVRQPAPDVDLAADAVDDPGVLLVLLLAGGESLALVEDQGFPGGLPRQAPAPAFLRLGDGRDEFGAAAALDDVPDRLAVSVEFPMPARIPVRGVAARLAGLSIAARKHPPPGTRRRCRRQGCARW